MLRHPLNQIINVNEINWPTVAGGFLTWAERGVEFLQYQLEDGESAGVTIIAAIAAHGLKALTIIGKGKTSGCLAGSDLPAYIDGYFSLSDWPNTDVMCRYLHRLWSTNCSDHASLIIILDTYSAHCATIVRDVERSLNITLLLIPPGCTDRLQSLDRRFSVC
jgi:hypothetical protein